MLSLKLGLRNLTRNRWRSGLTVAAIAVAVGLMVWTLAFYDGWIAEMIRGATAVETGQVQVHTAAYVEAPRSYRSFPLDEDLLARVRAVPGVVAVTPRVKLFGLVGHEERSVVARVLGVDPRLEAEATPAPEGIVAGRWLSADPPPYPAPREVVLGEGMAAQLAVGPGDELVVFLEASDGSLGNDLLEVVGVVRTGNTAIDRMGAYLHLADAQTLGALEGQVHELAIRTSDIDAARETAEAVAAAVGGRAGAPPEGTVDGATLVVQSWQEVVPAMHQMIVLFERSYWFMYLMIYLLAAIGILNTQRMSALERRREFGVLMAIGMRPRRMLRTLLAETVVLALVGAAVGALGGGALAWYHATHGLDMTLLTENASFSYMGVAFSERIYFDLSAEALVEPVLVMLAVAALSGLWPAVKAARIDPAPTIAGRT